MTSGPVRASGLPVTLGRETLGLLDASGQPYGAIVTADLRQAPHVLVSGTTGSGKSVALHGMIFDLLSLPGTGLVLIDPKRVEFGEYRGLSQLVGPSGRGWTYTEPATCLMALEWVLAQTETRFALMAAHGAKDVSQVPSGALRGAGQPPTLVVLVDELADLVMSGTKRLPVVLARILQLGRAAGVHVVLATQRPSHDVVTGVIKANVPTRLCFALQNATDSRVALGIRGAEVLTGKGDALWLPVGARTPVRLQGRMVADSERYALIQRLRAEQSQETAQPGSDGQSGVRRSGGYARWLQAAVRIPYSVH